MFEDGNVRIGLLPQGKEILVGVFGLVPVARDNVCSNATLKGTFGFKGVGVQVAPPDQAGPIADVNTLTFYENGAVRGSGVVSGGTMIPVSETGTYKVNPDCTGTYEVLISPLGATAHYFFVIVDSRNELQIICTDSGYIFSGTARRQFVLERRREERDPAEDSQE